MWSNPLIDRYRYSVLRPSYLWVYILIYMSITALLFMISFLNYSYNQAWNNLPRTCHTLYNQFFFMEVIILCVWTLINTFSVIPKETQEKSIDFTWLLPLGAFQKITGILIGKNLLPLLLAACNAIILLVLGILGDIHWRLQVQLAVLLPSIALAVNALALLSTICRPSAKSKPTHVLVVIVLCIMILPQIIRMIVPAHYTHFAIQDRCVSFFGTEIALFLFFAYMALYIGIWALIGGIRKINKPHEPLFNRVGAVLFITGYNAIVLGIYWSSLYKENTLAFYALNMLPPLIFVPVASLRRLGHYLEYSRIHPQRITRSLLLQSNIALGLVLLLLWFIFLAGTFRIAAPNLGIVLLHACVLGSFYILLLCLLEVYCLFSEASRIGLLLGFLVVTHLLLPLIFAKIFHNQDIARFSLLGFLFIFSVQKTSYACLQWDVLIVNLLLCLIPLYIILTRFLQIAHTREIME